MVCLDCPLVFECESVAKDYRSFRCCRREAQIDLVEYKDIKISLTSDLLSKAYKSTIEPDVKARSSFTAFLQHLPFL